MTTAAKSYLIWSREHRAWWQSNRAGYCEELLGAGLYTEEEANSIVYHAGPEKAKLVEFQPELERLAGLNREDSVVALFVSIRRDCVTLAKLAAETPQFDNPLHVWAAQEVRDRYLSGESSQAIETPNGIR